MINGIDDNTRQTTVEHVHIHVPSIRDATNTVAMRLRVERELAEADLRPPGFSSGSILVIRKIQTSTDILKHNQAEWAKHLQNLIYTYYHEAEHPVLNQISSKAISVIFQDGGELLACLTHDILAATAWQKWYWQKWLQGVSRQPGLAIAETWEAQIEFLPVAFKYLKPLETRTALALLDSKAISSLVNAIHNKFELSGGIFSCAYEPGVKQEPITNAPWTPWLATEYTTGLAPQAQYLWGVSTVLRHAPAFVRTSNFEIASIAWLSNALAIASSNIKEFIIPEYQRLKPPKEAISNTIENTPRSSAIKNNQTFEDLTTSILEKQYPEAKIDPIDIKASEANFAEDKGITQNKDNFTTTKNEHTRFVNETANLNDAMEIKTEQGIILPNNGFSTELGGIFYLIHLLKLLGLPHSWNVEGNSLAEYINGWELIEMWGRMLLASKYPLYKNDPIWDTLGTLSNTQNNEEAGSNFPHQESFRLPSAWLKRFGVKKQTWLVEEVNGRLLIQDEKAGYLIADLPLLTENVEIGINKEIEPYRDADISISWNYGLVKFFEINKSDLETFKSEMANWWIRRFSGFLRYLLAQLLQTTFDEFAEVLLLKRGKMLLTRTHLDLYMQMDQINNAVRRAGFDCDPGWVPDLGYIILYHFGNPGE